MMILSLLKFEWQFYSRQLVFYIGLLACTLMGSILMLSQSVDSDILVTGPYHLARVISTLSMLILPFLVGTLTSNAVVRDRSARMTELVFSTGVSKWQFLVSRWLGLIVISCFLFVSVIVGILLGIALLDGANSPNIMTLASIVWSMSILTVPGIILLASILFTVAIFFHKNIAIYIVTTVIFFGYQLLLVKTGSVLMANPASSGPLLQSLFMIFEPFGSSAFFEQVKHWGPLEKNTQLFQLSGDLLYNRLAVLFVAIGMFAFCYKMFDFRVSTSDKNNKTKVEKIKRKVSQKQFYQAVKPNSRGLMSWLSFISQWKLEYLATIKTRSFVAVLLFWLVVLISEIISGFAPGGSLAAKPYAGTMEALSRFQYDVMPRFMSIFILFFAAEIAWREEHYNTASLVHASPVGNISLFFAKWFALLMIPLILITIAIVASSTMQIIYGGEVEWSVYLSLYIYNGLPMIAVASVCLFIQNISYNKVIGTTLSLIFIISAISPVGNYIGLEHPMFNFSGHPSLEYSDLIGFSAISDAFFGYMKFWLSLSAVMLLLGYGLNRRGSAVSLTKRCSFITKQWGYRGISLFVIFTLLSSYLGRQVYYQTNQVANYQSVDDTTNWRLGYEKEYQQYKELLSPKVIDINTKMDLYPEQREFKMRAQYTLTNPHLKAIKTVLLSTNTNIDYSEVKISGGRLKKHDPIYGQYLFELSEPMNPGDELTLFFNAKQQQNGYLGLLGHNLITTNFSYFRAIQYMPFFGFNHYHQIKSPSLRKTLDLEPLPVQLPLDQAVLQYQGDFSMDYDWTNFETVISTSANETAIAQGELLGQWKDNKRNYFHYKTRAKIRNALAYISGSYQKASREVDGIDLHVYSHKNHQQNVQHMLDAMSETVRYGNRNFGRYPGKELRLLEVPRVFGLTGYALPQIILISEHAGFREELSDKENSSFDQVFRRTVHEVAHQWWGHGLNGAAQEGEAVLVETLAKYTELVMLEKKYGKAYTNRLVEHEHQRYFNGRAISVVDEKPLYRADANHLIYSKGAVAMYSLKEAMGEININTALRKLVSNHSYPKPPATTLDLIAGLNEVANENQRRLIEKWFKKVVIDDFSIVSASYKKLDENLYQLDACLRNEKIKLGDAEETSTKREKTSVWLGIFKENIESLSTTDKNNDVLKLEQIQFINENQCVSLSIEETPSHIEIDPNYHFLDKNRDNNSLVPMSIKH